MRCCALGTTLPVFFRALESKPCFFDFFRTRRAITSYCTVDKLSLQLSFETCSSPGTSGWRTAPFPCRLSQLLSQSVFAKQMRKTEGPPVRLADMAPSRSVRKSRVIGFEEAQVLVTQPLLRKVVYRAPRLRHTFDSVQSTQTSPRLRLCRTCVLVLAFPSSSWLATASCC